MNNKSTRSGMGLLGVLQVVFIILKLVGVINWNWLIVLIPLWIYLVLILIGSIWILIVMISGRKG